MSRSRSVINLALVLSCVAFFVEAARHSWSSLSPRPGSVDPIAGTDHLTQKLRPLIRGHEHIGFLIQGQHQAQMYYRSQYSLAPTLLVPMRKIKGSLLHPPQPLPQVELVLGVFSDLRAAARLEKRFKLQPVSSLARGFTLYRQLR